VPKPRYLLVSQATRTLPRMAPKLRAIDELASGQWSLVTRQQLVEVGFARTRIAVLLRTGALRFVRPGIYATLGSKREWQQRLMASVLTCGDGAVASHSSAARLWDFVHRPEDLVEVLVRGSFHRGIQGVHRTTILADEDVSTRSGIRCTSFERTLCDCTTVLSPFQLGRVLDDGLRRREASLVRLHRCAARLDSGPGRRLGVIKDLLGQRDASFNPGGSASELHVLKVIRNAGLPEPVQQHPVRAGGKSYVLDFAWPAQKVYVEYYGLAWHSGASAVEYDSDRQTDLVGVEWRPLVFTDASSDAQIVRGVANALSTRQSDGGIEHRMSA
jgi:hypothetical protein